MAIYIRYITLLLTLIVATTSYAGEEVDYPDGYRNWTHIKTMVLHAGHPLEDPFKGIHHVYGNDKAVDGTRSGQFEDGAVLVFDLFDFVTKDKASIEGDRVLVGVMVKDKSRYASTGGWGFEGFKGNSKTQRLVNDGGKSCYDCHASKHHTDSVFSRWRD